MKTVSIRLITNFLKDNGLDPEKLKGVHKLYGRKHSKKIQITRPDMARIKSMLAAGKTVVMRPTARGSRSWEFMNPDNIEVKFSDHGGRPKTVVVHDGPFKRALDLRAQRLGPVLTELRKAAGVKTQVDMAHLMGVEQSSYSRYERGAGFPKAEYLAKLAHFVEENASLHPFKERLLDCAKAS